MWKIAENSGNEAGAPVHSQSCFARIAEGQDFGEAHESGGEWRGCEMTHVAFLLGRVGRVTGVMPEGRGEVDTRVSVERHWSNG